jgi:hypothetical protein
MEPLLKTLQKRDVVGQPIGAALIGDLFSAGREKNAAVDSVPIPVFGVGELAEIVLSESGRFE